jgi:hypothetical protein
LRARVIHDIQCHIMRLNYLDLESNGFLSKIVADTRRGNTRDAAIRLNRAL